MGYPMTWERVVSRNLLTGAYGSLLEPDPNHANTVRNLVAGDMRRLEMDSRDKMHLEHYAAVAGITEAQALTLLNDFFGESHPFTPEDVAGIPHSSSHTPERDKRIQEAAESIRRVRKAFEEAKKVDPDIWNWQATI